MPESVAKALGFLKRVVDGAIADDVSRLAASIAYWLIVTLAPLAAVIVGLESFLVRLGLFEAMEGPIDMQTGMSISEIMGSAVSWAGPLAPLISLVLVLLGAAAVFGQFVGAIGIIWKQPPRRGPVYELMRHNLVAFMLLSLTAFTLLAAVTVGSVLARMTGLVAAAAEELGVAAPEATERLAGLLTSRPFVVSFAAFILFTIAFEVVPRHRPRWREAALGGLITAAAFTVGDSALNSWLASTGRFDVFGTFSSLMAFVVWVYYSAYIALVGAEVTHVLQLAAEEREAEAGTGHA